MLVAHILPDLISMYGDPPPIAEVTFQTQKICDLERPYK